MSISEAQYRDMVLRTERNKLRQPSNRERCPRCELHGGHDYIDPHCVLCGGKGTIPTDTDTTAPQWEIRPTTDEMKLNKTERDFLAYLRISDRESVIGIQTVTLKLGDDCRYTPDFWQVSKCLPFTFFEVKGFWRDDARVKVKVAARLFPWAKFIAVQRDKSGWKFETIRP